jgi:hypothetical protein
MQLPIKTKTAPSLLESGFDGLVLYGGFIVICPSLGINGSVYNGIQIAVDSFRKNLNLDAKIFDLDAG